MPVKTITHPITGKTFKLGRNIPIAKGPRLSLHNYLLQTLPTPPETVEYTTAASSALKQMYGNDILGDCVIAFLAHLEGVLTGNATGTPVIVPETEVISYYSAIGNYVPGDPSTDNGCDEQTALNYCQQNGLPMSNNRIYWMAVNGHRLQEVRTAMWLFENVMFGVSLPDAWITPFPSANGFVWGKAGAPDPNNGHCFGGFGYTPEYTQISTWGMVGNLSNGALEKYTTEGGGELYTILSLDMIQKATQKAPNGFDFSQLLADIQSIS